MLNLYLAPRGFRAPQPGEAAIAALTAFLTDEGLVSEFADGAWAPGPASSRLFHADALESHLPAELTFDALRLVSAPRPRFLPEIRPTSGLRASCGECGDVLEPEPIEAAIARLRFLPVERFSVTCPACRAVLGLRNLVFEQPVAWARFWVFIEGAGMSRLNHALVERMGRLLGVTLTMITETPAETVEDWVPARRALRRRSS
jgi:hypothetical protein